MGKKDKQTSTVPGNCKTCGKEIYKPIEVVRAHIVECVKAAAKMAAEKVKRANMAKKTEKKAAGKYRKKPAAAAGQAAGKYRKKPAGQAAGQAAGKGAGQAA